MTNARTASMLSRSARTLQVLALALGTTLASAQNASSLPRSTVETISVQSGQRTEIENFVNNWSPRLTSDNAQDVKRAIEALTEPLHDRGVVGVATKARLGDEIQLFHDCAVSELTLRQIRNQKAEDLAPFGLRLDVFRFDGSFLSLVVDLPKEAIDGLQKRHLIRLTVLADVEKPIEIFARLNIRHGPNTEQVVLELPMDRAEKTVEFDLAYTDLNEKRTEAAWIDLIFEGPEMNQITLRDLTLCRYPRAEL